MTTIGIDLGTTNSSCGVLLKGEVTLIPNRLGELLTPSVVGIDDNKNVIFGKTAKERLISHPSLTVAVFKRLMGTANEVHLGKSIFSPVELSAVLLRALKEDAETFLGEPVTNAVISVPAYFNDNQRVATKTAGELAGLKVNRLINEPTAAAIAYGLNDKKEGTFLILDMGGGTFDVSILEFFDGVMEVHASAGDNFLGGEDFVDTMVTAFLDHHEIDKSSLPDKTMQDLILQMETAKRKIDLPNLGDIRISINEINYSLKPTSEWFNKLVTPLLLRAKTPIEQALRDAELAPSEIDDVILVGGSTRLKLFRNMVGRLFGRLLSCHLDPDLVVAMGASIQAGLVEKNQALNDIVLTDVCPYTLGIEVNGDNSNSGGHFAPIIERNTTVPSSIVKTFYSAQDNQKQVKVNIFQGEHRLICHNVFLGDLEVKIPKGPAGSQGIDVRFSYDVNGILEVDVTVTSTGKVFSKIVEQAPGSLSKTEKEQSKSRLAKLKFHPREGEANRALISRGNRLYEMSMGDKRAYIGKIMAQFEAILEKQNSAEIKKASQNIEKIFDELDESIW